MTDKIHFNDVGFHITFPKYNVAFF
jgi:hypothetical protein